MHLSFPTILLILLPSLALTTALPPKSYGILLYRAFDPLDIFGPLEILYHLFRNLSPSLHLLSSSFDLVTPAPLLASMNPANPSAYPALTPTATFSDDPDLDVLIIPGGMGMQNPDVAEEIEYVKKMWGRVGHVVPICTGSGLLARTGLVDGRRMTTNKATWAQVVGYGEEVGGYRGMDT